KLKEQQNFSESDNYLLESDIFEDDQFSKQLLERQRKELEKMSVRFVMDDYTQFLKQEYPVKVHEKTFNRFIAK
ncbi:MAG: hypothetical protein MJ163_02615, partial [Alphaproteobacteria bacterium]|nr:hypothetical protein [Alphaproteobacteria bacterium]